MLLSWCYPLWAFWWTGRLGGLCLARLSPASRKSEFLDLVVSSISASLHKLVSLVCSKPPLALLHIGHRTDGGFLFFLGISFGFSLVAVHRAISSFLEFAVFAHFMFLPFPTADWILFAACNVDAAFPTSH